MVEQAVPPNTSAQQPATDPHRGWLDDLAELHRRIAVEVERQIATTAAATLDGARAQVSLAQMLLFQEGSEATVFATLESAQAALGRLDAGEVAPLISALDAVKARVEWLALAVDELISDVERRG